ncbi:uncharacterized protein LODBEIA_P06670 [Lodderomyces beijingensis]|uniref:Uncharacterized protein n=1 Tax=Lodderomyces beijingensis TaxID=1775926 RepID=A0ABP0ZE50_9ASCO
MRSLPPPRLTRTRRFKRVRRALKNLCTKGYISDFGVFHKRCIYSRHLHTISKIHISPILARMKRTDFKAVQSATWGVILARCVSRLVTKASLPGLRDDILWRRSRLNLSLTL